MELKENLYEKLKNEGRTKKWFVKTYLPELDYTYAMQKILGYITLSEDIKKAIEKYLGE